MSTEREGIEAVIAGLEAQRAVVGDALVDAAVASLRDRLAAIDAVPATAGQTLRQVSVLFLDVVDSTTFSQRLDPEEIHGVIDGLLARATTQVEAHGGKVLQYAGDSLLAVFGADATREDDAERAVRAGLALVDGASSHERSASVTQPGVRVGIHTGDVLLGGGVDAEGSVRGITVNVAARMEQTAPTGRLRISHDTYRHVRGVFDVEPQPPLAIKGIDEPVTSYLVLRAKPRAFRVRTRGIEGIETRMVGRDAELARLQAAFTDLHRGTTFAVVTVVAEAGVGKSRLLYEFENWAESRAEPFVVYRGRAQPGTRDRPYGLLRDVIAWRLQIDDDDTVVVARRKIEDGLIPLFADEDAATAESRAHLVGHLIGLDFSASPHLSGILRDGPQIRVRAFDAAARMFRRMVAGRRMPLLLVLDDLHWADDGSLDFLDHLAACNRDVPMLLIELTRPSLFERRPDRHRDAGATCIALDPLGSGVGPLLVDELLKMLPTVPASLRDLIASASEGNPFYMEELVKMLVDEGVVETGAEHWVFFPERLSTLHVPTTLTGVLQARLDSLDPPQKVALQQASVIGPVFWDRALATIDPASTAALPSLSHRELVTPQAARLDDAHEYAFKHHILHQVTYDTVLKRTRRECHARVAAWLAGLRGARASDFLGATARHYREAGDIANACEFLARAAAHAQERHAHEATQRHVREALALLDDVPVPDAPALRWRLLDARERTCDLLGRRTEQWADIVALEALADEADDDDRRGDVAWRRCDFGYRTGDWRGAEVAARETIRCAGRAGNVPLGLRGRQRLAGSLSMLGAVDEGKALALSGLDEARALGLRDIESLFLSVLNFNASLQDELDTRWSELALAIDRSLGNRRFEARGLNNIGEHLLVLGENERSAQYLEEGLRLTRAVGDRTAECYPLISLSVIALRLGDAERAFGHAVAAETTAVAVQSIAARIPALLVRGHAELALGRHGDALATYDTAHELASSTHSIVRFDAIAGLAQAALAAGDEDRAVREAERILGHLRDGGTLGGTELPRLILLVCHRVLERVGDARAAALLDAAHDNLVAKSRGIADPARRRRFLDDIPEHREIVTAWEGRRATGRAAAEGD